MISDVVPTQTTNLQQAMREQGQLSRMTCTRWIRAMRFHPSSNRGPALRTGLPGWGLASG
jgi:hypothetical protein